MFLGAHYFWYIGVLSYLCH